MKKRIILLMIIFSSLSYVAPYEGHSVLAREENSVKATVSGAIDIFADSINKVMNKSSKSKAQKITWVDGYTTSNVNIRAEPSIESEILEIVPFNSYICFYKYNDEWLCVKFHVETKSGTNLITAYVKSEYVSTEKCSYIEYPVPNNTIKSYMDYTAISSKKSKQYKLRQNSYTGNYGIRQVNGRYCVAVGSYFTTEIGTYMDLILENGNTIPCILADCKANKDTDTNNVITHDGSLAEFVVDTPCLSKTVKYMGDISTATEDWESPIIEIKIYERKVKL